MSFFLKWLRVERPSGVALHPARRVDLDLPPADAFDRCIRGIEEVLGGAVRERDKAGGFIEASFGLINSERMNVRIEPREEGGSRVRIESRRLASAQQASESSYVQALAEFLQA